MKLRRIVSGVCAVGCVLGLAGTAAATQPLQTFVDAAQKHGIEGRIAAATIKVREAESQQTYGQLLPSLSARGVYTLNQREVSFDPAALAGGMAGSGSEIVITPLHQLDAFVTLEVPLLDLAKSHRYAASKEQTELARTQAKLTRTDLSRGVVQAYYRFLGASALLQAAQRSVDAASANVTNVEVRRAAGAATELDFERAKANVEGARQAVADAELTIALSARTLATLSGLNPTPSDVPLGDDLHPEAPLEHWELLARNAPAAQVAAQTTKALREARRAASAAALPTLNASFQERITNATGFGGDIMTYNAQLTLGWRLDYATWNGDRAKDAELEVQQIRNESTERSLADGVFEAHHRITAGIARCRAARAQAQATERAAALAQERFALGAATQLDVTQAQRDAFQAAANSIQADADLASARANLRLAAGTALDFRSNP
jgi:outer membrane protein TolC